jgi:hypothetical protein
MCVCVYVCIGVCLIVRVSVTGCTDVKRHPETDTGARTYNTDSLQDVQTRDINVLF